jgi:hypothetical protein
VFDNADDVGMWVESMPESGRLIDCLPRSSHGSIIFTTRDKKTAVRLASRSVVEMTEMDEAGGRQLLRISFAEKPQQQHRWQEAFEPNWRRSAPSN